MEEDPNIDIEENTFTYPIIESIYSDVNIKTEILDSDEDDYDSVEIAETTSDYYVPITNKIILGSKPSSLVLLEPIPGPSSASDNWENQENFFECTKCNSLFPTRNELDSHKLASHSFLVARPMSRSIKPEKRASISSTSSLSFLEDSSSQEKTNRRQIAVKSTSKSSLNKTYPIQHIVAKDSNNIPHGDVNPLTGGQQKLVIDKGDRLLCKHCDVQFPNEIALIKHTYELLPDTQFKCDFCLKTFDTKAALKGHRAIHFRKIAKSPVAAAKDLLLQCTYCTCFLKYEIAMKKHLLNNHKVTQLARIHVQFPGKCAICSKTMENHHKYNKHVLRVHRRVFLSRVPFRFDTASTQIKCSLCNQIFSTPYAAHKHKVTSHPGLSKNQTFHTVYDKPIKQLYTYPHIVKPKLQTPRNALGKKTYVPKYNLFKCNKCQIHFVSCSAAFAHSKRCSLAKGDWKCNKCRRTFTKAEIFIHSQQHQICDKFKVHIVCDKILSKVLCRCPKCELHFDQVAFREHVSTECIPESGVDCNTCNLKLHVDSYAKHKRYHSKYNFLSGDFIIIEFVDITFQSSPIEENNKNHYKQKLLYCRTCSCYFYSLKSKLNFHLEGKCENSVKKLCTICGLVFTKKPYITHMNYDHETLKLKLDDILFLTIPDSKVIYPAMPDFIQCDKCEIRFSSPLVQSNHSCSKQVFVKCPKCSQKYDSVTYDIHLTFHNYGGSKPEKDVSSNVLKLYSCLACNYGFHSYDSVVEHCQKHYTNSENLATNPCKICKLNYADAHSVAHSSRGKFEIYKFDYEKLLTDDWLDGFHTLPKDAIEAILSKSVYGVLRNVRLRLLVEGPTERTLYKCAQCELNFVQDAVVEHTMGTCSGSPQFNCNSCAAVFNNKSAKNTHMNVHVVYGDDITFREIMFNYGDDKELNEALITGKQKESLKFRNCHQCKLLIKKSDYDAHISSHNDKFEIKHYNVRHSNKIIGYKLFKPVHTNRKLYTVYKCKSCNACIMKKVNMARHKCGLSNKYIKCRKCSLYFLPCNIKRHILQHPTIPKFIPKNISVVEFELQNSSKRVIKKRRRYSSDDDVSTGSQINVSVSKTYETRKVKGRPYSDNFSEDSQDNILKDASKEGTVTSNTYAKKYFKKSYVEKTGFNYDIKFEETQIKTENTPEISELLMESSLDIERWRIDMKSKLYQCETCYLCFAQKQLLVNHLSNCKNSSLSEIPLICNRCDLILHPSLVTFHKKLHEQDKHNAIQNYFFLINISTNGVDTTNEKRWLYKCKVCNVHYLSLRTLENHFASNHSTIQDYLICDDCGLQFTQQTRTKHMRIQHTEGKWSKDDLHIEILQKKIVKIGETDLKLFVASTYNEGTSAELKEIVGDESQAIDDFINNKDSTIIQKFTDDLDNTYNDSNTSSSGTVATRKDPENNSDNLEEEEDKIDHNLYKCGKCYKHYLTRLTLLYHIQNTSHKRIVGRLCDICGLLFDPRTVNIHKDVQHEKMKLTRKDFVILNVELNFNDNDIKAEVVDSAVLNVFNNNSGVSNISVDARDLSLSNKKIHDLNSYLSTPKDKHLYKCVKCSVCYMSRNTLFVHIFLKKHQKSDFSKCDICGFLFGKRSLIKHKDVQHGQLNLKRKDFVIIDVFGSPLIDDENNDDSNMESASSINMDDHRSLQLEGESEPVVKNLGNKQTFTYNVGQQEQIKIFRLYQCQDCRICVRKFERKHHICCSDIQKKQCTKCSLSFRSTDVIQHRRLHRNYRQLTRRNFLLIRFGKPKTKKQIIYKCVRCSTHFTSLTAVEWHMNTRNHKTKRGYCNKCGLFFGKCSLGRHNYIHHIKLNLTVQQFNIIYVSDTHEGPLDNESKKPKATSLNNSVDSMLDPDATSIIEPLKKLFKCVECGVCFLTRASYYHHIYKHKKLDTAEYIDCNICDLQFLNESLGVHMKSHKDKSFCLDKLLIEEYQPNSADSPKIKCYFAKDSLNAKLVSTTTPFDDYKETVLSETDEQLSVIDSTSDEVPKATASGEIDENLYRPGGDSGHVETLNPSVELPNLDVCAELTN